jgi:Predicted membrane protein
LYEIFKIFVGILLITLAVAIVIIALFPFRFQGGGFGMMYSYPGIWLFGPLFMIISLIVLFIFIYWIVNTLESHENSYVNSYDKETGNALDILNLRYAKWGNYSRTIYKNEGGHTKEVIQMNLFSKFLFQQLRSF